MRIKLYVPSDLRLASEQPAFKPAWYYGFAYRQTRAFASVYYIIPLNLIIRFWRWLQIFFWTIIFKVIYQFAKLYMWWRYKKRTFPVCTMGF